VAVIREGGPRRGAVVAAIAATCVLPPAAFTAVASAATVEVTPGVNAINKALDRAHNGDTLRIHDGTYREALTIDKRVELQGVGGRPLIDSRCKTRATIQVTHGGVVLNHLRVVGAAETTGQFPSEIDVEEVGTGTIHDVVVHDPCGGVDEGAEYGINVFNSGRVNVTGNRATGGFSDAGIYIGGITDTGTGAMRVVRNQSRFNHQGIIIENSAGGRIRVAHNTVRRNTIPGEAHEDTGIFINNSDRVRIRSNHVQENGHFGVNIGPGSDHNSLLDNTVTGNPIDLNNDGAANCGSGNGFGTRTGAPLVPCA
jgi:parallel beta-helix repeat protein